MELHKKVEEVSQKDHNSLPAGEAAEEAARKARTVEELEKLQKEKERENVEELGNGITLVGEKLHKTVTLVAAHNSEITSTRRQLMGDMVNSVNQLQRTTAKAEDRVAWEVAAVAGVGARKDETRWVVKKVCEDVPARSVLASVARDIAAYVERSGDFLHARIERLETVMLVAPQAPAAEITDRMTLQRMLKEENKEVRWGDRVAKQDGACRNPLGIRFEVADKKEAERLIKCGGIRWKGQLRKVQVWEHDKLARKDTLAGKKV